MGLAERAGLFALARDYVRVCTALAVRHEAGLKIGCLVAGMAAGADSIDDLDVLRYGAMPAIFGGVRAPSTLGSFLRSFTWGNVLQLDKVNGSCWRSWPVARTCCPAPPCWRSPISTRRSGGSAGGASGTPTLDGAGVVAVGTYDFTNTGAVYLLNAATGAIVTSIPADPTFAQSVLAHGLLFTASGSGVTAWAAGRRRRRRRQRWPGAPNAPAARLFHRR